MIRADLYRLLHSKGFYITEAVLIFAISLSIMTKTAGTMGANTQDLEKFQIASQAKVWNSITSVSAMSSMASILIYLILPLFIMTIGFDFSRKIYKNPLSSGMTRINYFISKYFVFLVLIFLQFVFYYGTIFIVSGLKNGWGNPSSYFLHKIIFTIGLQVISLLAIFAISIFIMYLSFSTVASIIFTIVFPLIISIISAVFKHTTWLKYFDFQLNMNSAYFMHYSSTSSAYFFLYALATILVCLVSAYLVFQRKDL